jgi:hypothetical protein
VSFWVVCIVAPAPRLGLRLRLRLGQRLRLLLRLRVSRTLSWPPGAKGERGGEGCGAAGASGRGRPRALGTRLPKSPAALETRLGSLLPPPLPVTVQILRIVWVLVWF